MRLTFLGGAGTVTGSKYLLEHEGMTPAALSHMLYRESGLRGVSGLSSELPVLLAAPVCALAADTPVTFTRDVAPIVYAKCGTCHRPDATRCRTAPALT